MSYEDTCQMLYPVIFCSDLLLGLVMAQSAALTDWRDTPNTVYDMYPPPHMTCILLLITDWRDTPNTVTIRPSKTNSHTAMLAARPWPVEAVGPRRLASRFRRRRQAA
jgi:hypothetical protein